MSHQAIIVGGGISGLAVAHRLIEHGITDVLILEAKDRLGGRVRTLQFGSAHIDHGAQWIHGEGNNPLQQLARMIDNIHETPDEDRDYEDGELFYTQTGQRIPAELAGRTNRTLSKILADADSFSRNREPLPTGYGDSVGLYLKGEFDKHMSDSKDANLQKAMLDWRLRFEQSDNACTTMDEMSLYSWGEYIEYDGNQDVVLRRGFQPILDLLLRDIPGTQIRTGCEVTGIDWSQCAESPEGSRVRVTLETGEVLPAEHVIFTGSLGVLKSRATQMFTPSLGPEKMTAIGNLAFGVADKIFVEFEKPFWDDKCSGIHLTWDDNSEPFRPQCLDDEHLKKYGEWYRGIETFETFEFQPNTLEGWIAGEAAITMERIDEDIVAEVCFELLQRFTGMDLTKPVRISRSLWGSEPHILGSYTYITCGHTAEDCRKLGLPLPSIQDPRVQIAGEATDVSHFSTANGALISAKRAADYIINASSVSTKQKS